MKKVSFWYGSVVVIVALAAIGLLSMTGAATSKLYASDDPMVTLPGDDSAHPNDDPYNPTNTLEWWYWTGHLRTEGNRWFGFETTFFSYPTYGAQRVDQAVTDIADGTFHFISSGPVFLGEPDYVQNGFDLAITIDQPYVRAYAKGGDGHDVLHGEVDGYVFDLELDSKKDPVLQYGTGFIDYYPFFGVPADSFYYSREHMKVKGTIQVDGELLKVTGTAWFDHQWGNQIPLFELDIEWNWFAIQLNDQREIMVYLLRKDGEIVLSHGSLSNANGDTIELEGDDFTITPKDTWKGDSGCVYDMGWIIEVAGMTLHVDPVFENQEVVDGGYWEGVAIVTGTRGTGERPASVKGRAFVEMVGYCN